MLKIGRNLHNVRVFHIVSTLSNWIVRWDYESLTQRDERCLITDRYKKFLSQAVAMVIASSIGEVAFSIGRLDRKSSAGDR